MGVLGDFDPISKSFRFEKFLGSVVFIMYEVFGTRNSVTKTVNNTRTTVSE